MSFIKAIKTVFGLKDEEEKPPKEDADIEAIAGEEEWVW